MKSRKNLEMPQKSAEGNGADLDNTGPVFLTATISTFQTNKALAERAVGQVPEEKLHVALDENTNSIAVIMKHVAGNLRSRWTEFLTSDGEKAWRNRDDEFIDGFRSRQEVIDDWEQGWTLLFTTLGGLTVDDLGKTVFIRGAQHSVPLAIARSLGHTCYHVGQIMQLARFHAGPDWTTITIPRGQSEAYNLGINAKGTRGQL